jgi:hypothetical protein
MRNGPASFVWIFLGALALMAPACSSLPWGTAPANPDRVELTENFKNGDTRLECLMRCAFTWGLERPHAKALYDTRAWSDLARDVLRIGYADDLSYFYLGKAAEGLGHYRGAEAYYRLSRAAALKCADIYGYCYGFVFPRDATAAASAVVKKTSETKRQYAGTPRPKEAPPPEPPPSYASSALAATPPSEAQSSPFAQSETTNSGDANQASEPRYPVSPPKPRSAELEKRSPPPAAKKPIPPKPVQQAESSKPRSAEAKTGSTAAVEEKAAEPESKAAPDVTFEEVSEKFGTGSRLTEAQKREEWKKYQGRCVVWAGELSYVGDGFLRGLALGFKHNPRTLTYDVLIATPDNARDAALRMKKGAHYTYRGTLKKYGGPILPISLDWGCRGEQRANAKTD